LAPGALLFAALTIGTGISLLSTAKHIYQFYLLLFYAFLGATVCWALVITMAQRWFEKNSGTATGIVAAGTRVGILFYSVAFGLFFGGNATLISLVVRQNFGTQFITRILGTIVAISAVGAIVGPVLAGYIVDASGSYTLAFIVAGVFMVINGLLVLSVKVWGREKTGCLVFFNEIRS